MKIRLERELKILYAKNNIQPFEETVSIQSTLPKQLKQLLFLLSTKSSLAEIRNSIQQLEDDLIQEKKLLKSQQLTIYFTQKQLEINIKEAFQRLLFIQDEQTRVRREYAGWDHCDHALFMELRKESRWNDIAERVGVSVEAVKRHEEWYLEWREWDRAKRERIEEWGKGVVKSEAFVEKVELKERKIKVDREKIKIQVEEWKQRKEREKRELKEKERKEAEEQKKVKLVVRPTIIVKNELKIKTPPKLDPERQREILRALKGRREKELGAIKLKMEEKKKSEEIVPIQRTPLVKVESNPLRLFQPTKAHLNRIETPKENSPLFKGCASPPKRQIPEWREGL